MDETQIANVEENSPEATNEVNQEFDINSSPSHILHRVGQVASDLYIKEFGKNGLTQRQFAVLAALSGKNISSQSELVNKTGIDRSTLAEIVARMEKRGLLLRKKSATDSRANDVSLTAEGFDEYQNALPRFEKIDAEIISSLGAGKKRKFIEIMALLVGGENQKLPKAEKDKTAKIKKDKKAKKAKKEKKKKRLLPAIEG